VKQNRFLSKKNDYCFIGIGSVVLAGILLYALKDTKFDAAMVPRLICGMMMFLGVVMIVDSYLKYKKNQGTSMDLVLKDFTVGIILPGIIVLMAAFMLRLLGFYISAFIVIVAIFYLQDVLAGKTFKISVGRVFYYFLFACGVSVFMFVMFNVLLGLPTPPGIFEF
jgi:hypothetical protein